MAAGVLVLLLLALALPAAAQRPDTLRAPLLPDSLRPVPLRPDSLRLDSLRFGSPRPDSLPAGSAARTGPGSGARPVAFSSADSLVILLGEGDGRAVLTGQAKVTSDDATLEAYTIDLFFDRNEVHARGLVVDTGIVGLPRFAKGEEAFTGRELRYNLESGRGRVVGARTQIEDGYLLGGIIKQGEDSTLFVKDGAYTTCSHGFAPHYHLQADRMKIAGGKWVYTGPVQLYVLGIPTPVWLPFGFFPAQEGRRSGPLAPRPGEDERGFFIDNLGWYFAISDYLGFQISTGAWTKGSWRVNPVLQYNRRYWYSGSLNVDWVRQRRGEREDPDREVADTRSLRWNHNQRIDPNTQLTGDVNLSSRNYLRSVSEDYRDRVSSSISSTVTLSRRWPSSGRSITLNARQTQHLASGETSLTLPNLSFSQQTRSLFKAPPERRGERERWYEKITYSYSSRVNNDYTFDPIDSLRDSLGVSWWDGLLDPEQFRRATGQTERFRFRATHSVPVSASFTVNRLPFLNTPFRLNLTPNLNYNESWYLRTERRVQTDSVRVERTTVPDFFALRQFSSGASANTEFFGLFPYRVGPFNGFRHVVRPGLSFVYQPDFGGERWGYFRTLTRPDGTPVVRDTVSGEPERYALVPEVGTGEQRSLSLSVSNVFQGRLVRTDSTGEETRRPIDLLNLDVSSAYNFAADSLRFSPLNLSARTNLFNQLFLNFGAQFSPYALGPDGQTLNRLYFRDRRWRPLRLTNFNLTARTSLRSRRAGAGDPYGTTRAGQDQITAAGAPPGLLDDPFESPYRNTPVGYADFSIPWSLDLSLTYHDSRSSRFSNRSFTVNSSFDFNVTPKWKVQGSSGFDFLRGEIVTTEVSIMRDLHCWEMRFNWVPFGQYQSFSFDLHVKSGQLRDILRLTQPRSDVRGRFGNLVR